jgi:predicted Zn finger-like uncharacterized protein
MIITCEQCQASFKLDEKLIKPSGSKVRCSKCSHVFTAFPPAPQVPDEIVPQFEMESDELASPTVPSTLDTDPGMDFKDNLPGLEEVPGDTPALAEDALDDLDLQLDLDPASDAAAQTTEGEDEDLDLSGIDSLLEETEEPVLEDQEEEFLTDLDLESAAPAELDEAPADIVEDEKIDLSEIEQMLDMDDDDDTPQAQTGPTGGPEVELELEPDEPTESPADFDMDEEIDLSEIEKMLEVDADTGEEEAEETLGELELTLERTVGTQEALEELDFSEEPGEPTLDVADVDEMLEKDTPAAEEGEFGKDLDEFELEFELDENNDTEAPADLEMVTESPPLMDEAEPEAEDLEMEFDIEVEHPQEALSEEVVESETESEATVAAPFEMGIPSDEIQTDELEEPEADVEEEEEEEPEVFPVSEKLRPRRKRGIGLPLVLILVLILAVAAAVVVLPRLGIEVPYLDQVTSRIPFLSQLTQPEVQDAGNLKINTLNINSSFVDNTGTGKLFVITGEVKNEYADPRSFIRIRGKLYSAGKTLAQTETVYCGNVISDLDLSALDRESIAKRLGNRSGDKKSNLNVPSGSKLPFMIVFGDLPGDLEEYTIEVVSSTAL